MKYKNTPGLYELIFKRIYAEADKQTYKNIGNKCSSTQS